VRDVLGLGREPLVRLAANAIEASFLDDAAKQRLRAELRTFIASPDDP
jgi:hypothetical protein